MHEVHYNRNAVYSIYLCLRELNESLKKLSVLTGEQKLIMFPQTLAGRKRKVGSLRFAYFLYSGSKIK